MPRRLRPSAPIAADAILTGDPARAMMLAQELTEQPLMSNHARGLWGYVGRTADGRQLTVQSTGTGAPSAVIVLSDLAGLGLRRAVRVGTCSSLDGEHALGEVLAVATAYAGDGVSRTLGRGGETLAPGLVPPPDPPEGPLPAVRAASFDLAPGHAPLPETGASVADLQTAALFAAAPGLGVELGALLVVAEAGGEEIAEEELAEAARRAGRIALALLSGRG
ncbi:MAG: hypothetical protein U0R52_12065 [Solirubrobacterales bacterium]